MIVIILFYGKQKSKIINKINDITYSINNWELVLADKRKRENEKRIKRLIQKRNKRVNKSNNKNKEKNKENKNNLKKEKKTEEIAILNPIDYNFLNNILNKNENPPKKRKADNNNHHNNNIFIIKNSKSDKNSNSKILDKKKNEQEIIKRSKKIMEYDDEEKNNLKYDLALKYDKRTFIQYYISLLKTKHTFIFSFFNDKDYNSRIIKIDLFFVSFVIYYTVNALFFNDDTMHKIYEDEGSFNLIYQLPQIIYSSLISSVITTLIKYLALSEKNILEIKNEKENMIQTVCKIKKCINIKFNFFYLLNFIFLIFFWYYLGCFCAVYKNTQILLIEDTIISFIISLLYPFVLNLLPGILRIPSLNAKNKNRILLYNLSRIIQII